MENKNNIIFLEWVINYLKSKNITVTIKDLETASWKKLENIWNEKDLMEYLKKIVNGKKTSYYLKDTELVNILFDWESDLLTYRQFENLNDDWNFFEYNSCDLIPGINFFIFPEKKIRKLKVNFDC